MGLWLAPVDPKDKQASKLQALIVSSCWGQATATRLFLLVSTQSRLLVLLAFLNQCGFLVRFFLPNTLLTAFLSAGSAHQVRQDFRHGRPNGGTRSVLCAVKGLGKNLEPMVDQARPPSTEIIS